jgi:cyclin A
VVLAAPLSYGDDASEGNDAVTIKTSPKTKHPPQYDYDADIDATFRTMETEAMERPSPDYLSDRQAGEMMMMDRADLIDKMHRFSTHYDLAPGAFHRAVSFVDRFLSAKKISRDEREICLLGAAAVFAAAKYEDRSTVLKINSDHVAMYAGCTRSEAVDQERELVAVLGYRLSGPTAYTFVDHFMRHSEEEEVVRALAHHLADMALLDYRCVALLPSAVAASAILLARMALYYSTAMPVDASYTLEELSDCIQAIYDMHENLWVWPGCAQMMLHWDSTAQFRYFLPPLSMLIDMH